MKRSRIVKEAALWIVSLFLVSIFIRQGMAKFSETSGWATAFRLWGYPAWFRMLIGTMEVSAAILLLLPRVAAIGAALIIVVMLGGMGTHIARGHPAQITSELLPLILASVILYARRRAWRRAIPASTDAIG